MREYLNDGDPTCLYSLILETKNLHVEVAFERVRGQEKRGEQTQRFTAGPLTVYQLEKQYRVGEVATLCPER